LLFSQLDGFKLAPNVREDTYKLNIPLRTVGKFTIQFENVLNSEKKFVLRYAL
jgi:hypothetical protein